MTEVPEAAAWLPDERPAQGFAVDHVVPVEVSIPGCPPRRQAILNGLLVAMGVNEAGSKLDAREAKEA